MIFLFFVVFLLPKSINIPQRYSTKYKRHVYEPQYQQDKENNIIKYNHQDIASNNNNSLQRNPLAISANNKIYNGHFILEPKHQNIISTENEVQTSSYNSNNKLSIESHSKLANKRKPRLKRLEIPFNVTGWPAGSTLSVEDYVNYYQFTSILLPDASSDSSIFDDTNDISVLVGIGKLP